MTDPKSAQGPIVVRRLITDDTSAFWPEYIVACTQFVRPGWAGYIETLVQHVAQMGMRMLSASQAGTAVEDIPLSDWNAGAYLTMYQGVSTLPCNPGVAPAGIKGLTVLDETSVIEDGRVGFKVTAYAPREEDYLPGGTRLPMTELDRMAREVGSFKVLIQNGEGQEVCWASGIFDDEPEVKAAVQQVKDTRI